MISRMIEAACTACGMVTRLADADIPASATFVNCASCKSRVALPARAAAAAPVVELADLPAPRRQSALNTATPRGGAPLASEPGLPAPRVKKIPTAAPAAALELDDLLGAPDGGADLPAPRPKGMPSGVDLPAPKPRTEALRPPPPQIPNLADTAPSVDVPAPKPKTAAPADLPAPRPKLPAVPRVPPVPPVAPTPVGLADLPGPKPKPAAPAVPPSAAKPAGVVDLLGPKPVGVVDLPAPKPGVTDLPMPKPGQAGDLPAPLGFFDDLPQPARGGGQPQTTDVAPKGFFDDLPQPARASSQTSEIAPKGFFDDLPGRPSGQKAEVPAPKGFFDDLPGRANAQKAEVPAPKGFFDDLPGRTNPNKPEVPAPKGFFDDLPKPAGTKSGNLHLDSLDLEPVEHSQPGIDLDMELPGGAPRPKPPSVAPAPGPSNQFDDLDLSAPSPVSFQKRSGASIPPSTGVATINPAAAAAAAAAAVRAPLGGKQADAELELEEPRQPVPKESTKLLGPKQREEVRQANAAKKAAAAKKSRKVLLIAILAIAVLGGGGFYAYRHFAKKAEHESAVNEQLGAARRAMHQNQWLKASVAAAATLQLENNAEAYGIRAESLYALGIVEGNNPGRIAQGRKALADASAASVSHPALDRAQALSPIAAGQPADAVKKLTVLATRAPKDTALQLYLGWAHFALGDYDAAIKAYDAAATSPTVKLLALFGRAHAKQAKGDLEGARADYEAVLAIQKDHVGAQVGLASSLPAQQAQQQEADLLAILALKDVEKKEPRAVMDAWILAAELARKGGRLDVARERYRRALVITPTDVESLTGLASVEMQDSKLDVATEMIEKALKASPNDMHASLTAVSLAITKKDYADATKKLETLAKRTPPPPVLDRARIKGLEARLLEAQDKEQDAIDAYLEAAKLAGEQDLTHILTAASKLTELADKYAAANDSARSSELRKKSDELLSALSDNALTDPRLALTLGMAYMQAGDPVKSETWLRKAIELQPKNVDAMYQLAKALSKQGKDAEAIGNLRSAVELDPTRSEIGLELARTYEDAARTEEAGKLYEKLLAAKEPTIELRARAGRFFARTGQMEKAGEQGVAILKQQEEHPAGLYLKGEGLLLQGKTDAARKVFVQATDADPEPQYLDARGRADEAWATESGNTTYQDDALRSYAKAVEKDPKIFASWLGQGRLYVLRKEDAKAVTPLTTAWTIKRSAEVARLLGIATKNLNQQPKVAAEWLEQSLQMEPHPDTAFNLGFLYEDPRTNDAKKAIAAYTKAVALGEELEKKGEQPPVWLSDALYSLGMLNYTLNNYKVAKQTWQKWLLRNPKQDGGRYKEVKNYLNTSLRNQ
jgi:tetratricopeptide (TPR) repeat protein